MIICQRQLLHASHLSLFLFCFACFSSFSFSFLFEIISVISVGALYSFSLERW